MAGQWLELRLQMLGCAVVTAIAIISVIQHKSGSVSPGLVGLAISYALGVTGNLNQLIHVWVAHYMVLRNPNSEFIPDFVFEQDSF